MGTLRALFIIITLRAAAPPHVEKYMVKTARWLLAAMFAALIADTIVHHFQ